MPKNRIMVAGEKESFLIRVLVKKLKDAGYDAYFANWTVNDLNAGWEDAGLIALYAEEREHPGHDTLVFLKDKLDEDTKIVTVIGEKQDIKVITDVVPSDHLYKEYLRPIDASAFIKDVEVIMDKMNSGEFKKSILIVDDDPNYMGLVRDWLKGTYKVSMANSGLQAIKWLGKNKADLILLDHEMPVTSGPQVLEMLRSDLDTASIPVMFLTGKSDKESVMAVLSLRPEGYFLKTIEKEDLLQQLKDFFIRHKK